MMAVLVSLFASLWPGFWKCWDRAIYHVEDD
jgi:hypothetical protein